MIHIITMEILKSSEAGQSIDLYLYGVGENAFCGPPGHWPFRPTLAATSYQVRKAVAEESFLTCGAYTGSGGYLACWQTGPRSNLVLFSHFPL
jgi:hypothetical protein